MSTPADAAVLKAASDCVFYLASPLMCKKGAGCESRHSELARLNTRDCHYWMMGTCKAGAACAFRHPPLSDELRSDLASGAVAPQSRVPCFFFAAGTCAKGDACYFSHATPETKPPNPPINLNAKQDPNLNANANANSHAKANTNSNAKANANAKAIANVTANVTATANSKGEAPVAARTSANGNKPAGGGKDGVTPGRAEGLAGGKLPLRGQVRGSGSAMYGAVQPARASGHAESRQVASRNATLGGGDGGEEGFDVIVTNPKQGGGEEGQRMGGGADLRNVLKRQRGDGGDVEEQLPGWGRGVGGAGGYLMGGSNQGPRDLLRDGLFRKPLSGNQMEGGRGGVGGARRMVQGEGVGSGRLVQQFLGFNGSRVDSRMGGGRSAQDSAMAENGVPRFGSATRVGGQRVAEAMPGGRVIAAADQPRVRTVGSLGSAALSSAPKSLSEILAEKRKGTEKPAANRSLPLTSAGAGARVVTSCGAGGGVREEGVDRRRNPVPVAVAVAVPIGVPVRRKEVRVEIGGGVRRPMGFAGGVGAVGFDKKPKSLEEILREKRKAKEVEEGGERASKRRGVGAGGLGTGEGSLEVPTAGVQTGERKHVGGEDHKESMGGEQATRVEAANSRGGREREVGGASSAPPIASRAAQQSLRESEENARLGDAKLENEGLGREGKGGEGGGGVERGEKEEVVVEGKDDEKVGGLGEDGSDGSGNYDDDLEDDDDLAKELGGFFT